MSDPKDLNKYPYPSGEYVPFQFNTKGIDEFVSSDQEKMVNRLGKEAFTLHGIRQQAKLDTEAAVESATAQAEGYRDQAEQARDDAIAAASASGDFVFAKDLADMNSKLPLPDGTIIEVSVDADHSGNRTRYVVENGAPVFYVSLTPTAKQVSFEQSGAGSILRSVSDKLEEFLSPSDKGAVGDGLTDDTDAIISAIKDGRPLYWGGSGKVYRVTRVLEHTFTKPMHWLSSGATILYDPPTATREVFRLFAFPSSFFIDGSLNINANKKAFIGFYLNNQTTGTYPENYADLYMKGLSVENVYRSGLQFTGGDGIWVLGGWRFLTLDECRAQQCTMATGAGVEGAQGIFGITVSGTSAGQPLNITINNPQVGYIKSDDLDYNMDQDGLRIIVNNSDIDPDLQSVNINGGVFENCYGRGIKIQSENSIVSGTKFIRTEGWTRGYGNQEIDFQEGGGVIENTTHIYNGSVPLEVVQFVATRKTGKKTVPFGRANGLNISLGSGVSLSRVFRNTLRYQSKQVIRASNIEVVGDGELVNMCRMRGGFDESNVIYLLSDLIGSPTGGWVHCSTEGQITASGEIKATRLVHLGDELAYLRSSTSGNLRPLISASDCVGFIEEQSAINTKSYTGAIHRVSSIASMNSLSGVLTPYSFRAMAGETYDIPMPGNSTSAGVVVLALGQSRDTQAIFGVGTQGARILAQTGSSVVAGDNSEPSSGNYKIWYESGALKFKNSTSNNRDVTFLTIG